MSSDKHHIPKAEKDKIVADTLRQAVTLAVQLEMTVEQTGELLKKEFKEITSQKSAEGKINESEK